LRTIDEEEYRRQQSRELNKGEARMTSRASYFSARKAHCGAVGSMTSSGRSVAWVCCTTRGYLEHQARRPAGRAVARRGHVIDDATLAQTTPLMRKHLNPFGRYHFNLERMRQTT